ncbi:MAG: DivIVA domain-containing protein [Acidimicrobiia bacterium]|nr:DivIVA domain-containing protein [Acidimicrobiia bacterium]
MPDLNPADISRQTFVVTKKGFDAQQVRLYLEELAATVAVLNQELVGLRKRNQTLESEVASTKGAEEALQMTLVTATRTKDEMLAEAKEQAEELRHEAFQEAQRARAEALRESDDLLVRSRKEALEAIEEAKRNAQTVIATAQVESRDLRDKVVHLRKALATTRATLEGTLSATLATVEEADDLLAFTGLTDELRDDPIVMEVTEVATAEEPVIDSPTPEIELVDVMVGEAPPVEMEHETVPVPTADQLLNQLRSIGD